MVLAQLLAWREIEVPRPEISYWRTAAGAEVDFVVESRGRVLPIEVRASSRARPEDARALEVFLDEHPRAAPVGLLLYGGKETVRVSPRVLAAPVTAVL
jgi:predicted AAA+ superfamily ATPase